MIDFGCSLYHTKWIWYMQIQYFQPMVLEMLLTEICDFQSLASCQPHNLKSCSWWARCGRAIFCSATLASSTSLAGCASIRFSDLSDLSESDAVSHLFWARSRVRLGMARHRRHVSVGLAAKCRFGCWKSRQLCAIACHSG